MLNLKVLELRQEYVIQYYTCLAFDDSLGDEGNIFFNKVVFMCLGFEEIDALALLAIHIFRKLAIFKCQIGTFKYIFS